MNVFSRLFGELLEWLRGPGDTEIVDGETIHRLLTVSYRSNELEYEISCKRIIYKTRYRRPFVPSSVYAVFEVTGSVITGQVDKSLERTEIYPDMSAFGLRETEYPHIRAISAYMDFVISKGVIFEA